ncbi:DHA2 family efflux MFS transporter permease subunit [Nocardia sp. ET3-3]|uniref:DHA2 family efflux MFS transporter permease subunit n=1 Tax=Nocardia terrae TaxID=2675851 RepID=A0A7K1URU6_9NOCA|nr:MDR family MFS transporter [Nocardia terrae]MVU77073.1 DHA2 family efflux MFS transporter permease subunit [Nocardia terrae]
MTSTTTAQAPRTVRWILLGVMLAMLLGMLDNMIVGTAMPTIVRELGGLDRLSWVVSAYTLATAASTPIWAKLGDLFGRKNNFLASIAIFLVGSGLSGAAQNMDQLIGFRVLQGIGAGGLAAGAFAIIGELIPPRERAKYMGMTASVMALATIGGPLVGGFVTDHLGWRWAFYLNLPLGLVAFVWCQATLHLTARRPGAKIDFPGAALLTVTISALVLLATWGGSQYAWGSPQVLTVIAIAAVGLPAFLWSQTRAPEPIIPLSLFANRNFALISVVSVMVGAAMFGATSFLPLFQQTVQGASASNSGLLLLPMMVPIIVVSQLAGRIMSKTGRYKVFPIAGGALLTAGSVALATMGADTSRFTAGVYMAMLGAGLGFVMQMTVLIAQNSVEMKDIGAASGVQTLFRTLGGSFGVALFGALFNRQVHGHEHLAGVTAGIDSIFTWSTGLCAVALIAALFLVEVPLRQAGPPAAPAPRAEVPVPQR